MDQAVESVNVMQDHSDAAIGCDDFDGLLNDWSTRSFQLVLDLVEASPNMGPIIFSSYSWELFDKVYEETISSTSCPLEVLTKTVELIANNNRPRELYMMAVEKIVGTGRALELRSLPVLLFAMRLAMLGEHSPSLMRDGLPLVLKALIDCTGTVPADVSAAAVNSIGKTSSNSHQNSKIEAVIGIALSFCDGLMRR